MNSPFSAPRLAAAGILLLGSATAALAGDIVQRKDGTFYPPIAGETPEAGDFSNSNIKVLDADMDEVPYQMTLKDKKLTQKYKASEVMEIWLETSQYPGPWKDAVTALNTGNYADAARAFRSIGDEKRVHPVVRQKALLNAARASAGTGNMAQAAQAYAYVRQVFPRSFYTRAVLRDLTQAWMDAGDETKALEAAGELEKVPGATDSDRIEARFLRVTVAYRRAATARDEGGIRRALDEYRKIAGETAGKPDLSSVNALARLGQANCALALGDVKAAKSLFQEISEITGVDNAALAAAFNGLGECWFRQNDKEGWTEARRMFLRTVVRYADGAPSEEVARALYFAGDCFQRLQDSEDWKDRARRELSECERRFPQSEWARKARDVRQALPK